MVEIATSDDSHEMVPTLPVNPNIEMNVGSSNNNNNDNDLNSRDIEKIEGLAKQRENYLNENTSSSNNTAIFTILRKMISDVDSHSEQLFYLLAIEMFFIFLTYTHYSYFDKKNRFLTPIVMGGETSILGQTLTQLVGWGKIRFGGNNMSSKKLVVDEEMNLNINTTYKHDKSGGKGKVHSRTSSNIVGTSTNNSNNITTGSGATETTVLAADKEASVRGHLKYLIWGGVNGLLCSYWIELLLNIFKEKKLYCVLVDQTVGTVIFQTLYSLFICLWDAELEATTDGVMRVDLNWENFSVYFASMLWKYMKLSYLVWPIISLLSFTVLSDEWIFPVNCFFTTLFGVMLSLQAGR